ncbi:hypothetical protein DL771_008728 [Monosporascus sp. 5C6A]|nr:hypothetical protein DL771_008728 [Monosporascus sp. 5C6A]
MGTRHLVLVYYKGQYRIAQYGQWDGYPEGQGVTVLRFVSDPENLSKLRSVLDAESMLYEPTKDQLNAWYAEMQRVSQEHYARPPPTDERELEERCNVLHPGRDVCPSVSRDTGADILRLVADATAEKPVPVVRKIEFLADTYFCEWAYVVDLDEHALEVYASLVWGTGGLPVLGDGSRFRRVESLKDTKSLPSLVGRFPFDNLPSKEEFVSSLTPAEVEELD